MGGGKGAFRALARALVPWFAALVLVGCGTRPAAFVRPTGVTVAPDGTLFVSDFQLRQVVVLGPDLRFNRTMGFGGLGVGGLWLPQGIRVDAGFNLWVVNHRPASAADPSDVREVKGFDRNGKQIAAFPVLLDATEGNTWPDTPAALPTGEIIVADSGRPGLPVFDRTGRFLRLLTPAAPAPPLASPVDVHVDGETLVVVEQYAHRIRRMTMDGTTLAMVGREGDGPGDLLFPSGVALAANGDMIVADMGNHRVQRLAADGTFVWEFVPAPAGPRRIPQMKCVAVLHDGRIVAADTNGARLLVLSADGILRDDLREIR